MAFGRSVTGKWRRYGVDPENKKEVAFCLRRIPAALEREIEIRHLGRKRQMKGGAITFDVVASQKSAVDKAMFILMDSRNCRIEIPDEGEPSAYTQLLGPEAAPGSTVCLDGKWTDDLKRQFLDDEPEVANWAISESAKDTVKADEDEEGKD
jgi:hypothetical protein